MSKFAAVIILILFFLAGFSFGGQIRKGRLVGHVDVGPVVPVERPGQRTPPQASFYRTILVKIYRPGPRNAHVRSHLLKIIQVLKLDAKGNFVAVLDPGVYSVSVTSNARYRVPPPQEVTIRAGRTTSLTLHVDTGIR